MEQEKINYKQYQLSNLPQNIIITITDLLQSQDLQAIVSAYSGQKYQINKIAVLAHTKLYILKYLNNTIRSMYLSFYDNPKFKKIEQSHRNSLSDCSTSIFLGCQKIYLQIFNTMRKQLSVIDSCQNILEQIGLDLKDPELPLPKMRRQGIGMFCQSSFQFFLVDLKFGLQESYLNECFQDLKSYIEASQKTYPDNLRKIISQNSDRIHFLAKIRYTPQLINSGNYKQFLIPQNVLNNCVVLIFALASNFVDSINYYLSSFHDPLLLFVEIGLRYSIFRNFILCVEEKYSFLFQQYGKILDQILGFDQNVPTYCFWRSALAIWYQTMKHYHNRTNILFTYLLTKNSSKYIIKSCEKLKQQFPSQTLSFLNKFQQNQFLIKLRQEIFNDPQNSLEDFFDKSPILYQQVLKDYLEYIVDLSINQLTVHWCGHSQHQLEQPYTTFEDFIMHHERQYIKYIQLLVIGPKNTTINTYIFKEILQREINYLNLGFLKPITLKKIWNYSNFLIQKCNKLSEEIPIREYHQLIYKQSQLQYQYKQQDKLVEHFNKKYLPNKSKNYALHQLNNSQKLLYSITSSAHQKMLARSIDTQQSNYLKNKQQQFNQLFDYISSSDIQQIQQTQQLVKSKNKQKSVELKSKY